MKVNELKGALLKRFAGEMETANGNNDNNLATSPQPALSFIRMMSLKCRRPG
jgi:hypothetical protein